MALPWALLLQPSRSRTSVALVAIERGPLKEIKANHWDICYLLWSLVRTCDNPVRGHEYHGLFCRRTAIGIAEAL